MLEGVLEPGGTASSVSVPGYVLAGKTGTAQKVENGNYSDTHYVASFVGIAPAEHPKLLVAVVVDEPQYVHVGGAVAAPVFGQIAHSRCLTWASRPRPSGALEEPPLSEAILESPESWSWASC